MIIKYLSIRELGKLIQRNKDFITVNGSSEFQEIEICSIADVLELAEKSKKGKITIDKNDFLKGFKNLLDGAIKEGNIILISFDQTTLLDSLFERDDQMRITEFWPPAIDKSVNPSHNIRRLTLRPGHANWWDGDIFIEAENLYLQ